MKKREKSLEESSEREEERRKKKREKSLEESSEGEEKKKEEGRIHLKKNLQKRTLQKRT